MIAEDYVSFEIAKLLREKGFDEETEHVYSDGGELLKLSHLGIKDLTNTYCNDYDTWQFPIEGVASIISVPTLQMTMKWLREVHNIHINIDPDWTSKGGFAVIGYYFNIHSIKNPWYEDLVSYSTYEEACGAAIKYCLEHLIK